MGVADSPDGKVPAPAIAYRSPFPLATILTVALAISIAADVAALVVDSRFISFVEEAAPIRGADVAEYERLEEQFSIVGAIQFLLYVLVFILFLVWFRRMYRNLGALGVRFLRYRPGWAIGGWFVPILNLFRPKQILNDVWRATEPGLGPSMHSPPKEVPVVGYITAWWALFLVNKILNRAASRDGAAGIDAALNSLNLFRTLDFLFIVEALLLITVVRSVSRRQESRLASRESAQEALRQEELSRFSVAGKYVVSRDIDVGFRSESKLLRKGTEVTVVRATPNFLEIRLPDETTATLTRSHFAFLDAVSDTNRE